MNSLSASAPIAVIGCAQLVTLAGPNRPRTGNEMKELAVIHRGAMLIRNTKIERVGPQTDIEPHITSEYEIVDAAGRVVLPGFVDAHTHPVFAGTRVDEYELRAEGTSYADIAAAGGGIRSTVQKTRAASEEDLLHVAKKRAQWFPRTGTTTIEAKSGYGLSLDAELKILRVIRSLNADGALQYVPTFLGAHAIPDEFADRADAYVEHIINEMLPAVVGTRLAEYCDVFCEPGYFDVARSTRILKAAQSRGLGIRVHADQLSLSGGAEMAAEIHAVTADHLEQIDESGIRALARSGVQPVLLPASVYTLSSARFAPARAMIDAGLAVVLATDFNPGSSPTPSIPFVMSLACTHMRMTPAEALTAVTSNAAYSLGRGSTIGSLEAGKQADFAIHESEDYREIPYFVGLESAAETFVRGRRVFCRSQV